MEDRAERKMFKATCSDCGEECEVPFQPTEGKTVRCLDCFRRSKPSGPRRSFGGGGRSFGNNRRFDDRPREMHKAVCAECKSDCEVPFKPTEGKPVLCKDCFRNKRNQDQEDF